MTTDNVIRELGERFIPLPLEQFFTAQRADDMWFGDELPPTIQAELRSPLVTQSKTMFRMGVLQVCARAEQRAKYEAEQRRLRLAKSRMGKRAKSCR